MEAIVDRIEGAVAVLELEDGRHADVPLSELPGGTGQGDVLVGNPGNWRLDEQGKRARLAQNRALMDGLFED